MSGVFQSPFLSFPSVLLFKNIRINYFRLFNEISFGPTEIFVTSIVLLK